MSSYQERWPVRDVPAELGERCLAEGWWIDDTLGALVERSLSAAPDATINAWSESRPRHGTYSEVHTANGRVRRVGWDVVDTAAPAATTRPADCDDVCVLAYTSGTTEHPSVTGCAFGDPAAKRHATDARFGEHACAVVRLVPGASLDLEAITTELERIGLARQKWPEELRIVEEFPRTPSGKVRKVELRRELRAGRPVTAP